MKFTRVALLCAAACASFAGPAAAQVSANPTASAIVREANGVPSPANPYGEIRIINIAGSPALAESFHVIAANLFTGPIYRFESDESYASFGRYVAYAGRLQRAASNWKPGSAVIIVMRRAQRPVERSGMDVVARGESIFGMNVSTAYCTTGAGTMESPFVCNDLIHTNEGGVVPVAGVSDVSPALFQWPLNALGSSALNESDLSSLSVEPLFGMAYGVALSNNLPLFSFNKAQVAGILAGTAGTWADVDLTATTLTAGQVAAGSTNDILLCREVNGSSAQAVSNLYFGNFPCGVSSTPADRESGPAWNYVNTFVVEGNTGGLNVVEHGMGGRYFGGVRTCLNNAVTASNAPFNAAATPGTFTVTNGVGSWFGTVGYTTYATNDRYGNPIGVAFRNGRSHKAIGVLSMDSRPNSANGATGFSFRALDGAGRLNNDGTVVAGSTGRLPTKQAYMDGTWDMQGLVHLNISVYAPSSVRSLLDQFMFLARDPSKFPPVWWYSAVGALPGTDDYTRTGNVLKAGYLNRDQCAPLSR